MEVFSKDMIKGGALRKFCSRKVPVIRQKYQNGKQFVVYESDEIYEILNDMLERNSTNHHKQHVVVWDAAVTELDIMLDRLR